MEPALVLCLVCALFGSTYLAATLRQRSIDRATSPRAFAGSRPSRLLVGAIVLAAIAGSSAAVAATPPPSFRLGAGGDAPSVAATSQSAGASISKGSYVVVKGDSLWRIARNLIERGVYESLEPSELWRTIYDANRQVVGGNPNLIHAGQVLTLPGGSNGS